MTRNPAWQCMECGSIRCDGSCPDPQEALDDELEEGRPWADGYCWFSRLPDAGPCEGRIVKCHLIKRQVLVREGLQSFIDDHRSWVPGCGGAMGPGGHHGMFKPDGPRPIPRGLLPTGFVRLCEDLALGWYLDRTYGPQDVQEAA